MQAYIQIDTYIQIDKTDVQTDSIYREHILYRDTFQRAKHMYIYIYAYIYIYIKNTCMYISMHIYIYI